MVNNITLSQLQKLINKNGFLLLNKNKEAPSIIGEGGNWQMAMDLLDQQHVFYSRFYNNKVTYLSKELYYCLRDSLHNFFLTEEEQDLFELLSSSNGLPPKLIRQILTIDRISLNKSLHKLSKNLLITVIAPGEPINDTWSQLEWGTYEQWETKANLSYDYTITHKNNIIKEKLSPYLSQRKLNTLLMEE